MNLSKTLVTTIGVLLMFYGLVNLTGAEYAVYITTLVVGLIITIMSVWPFNTVSVEEVDDLPPSSDVPPTASVVLPNLLTQNFDRPDEHTGMVM